MQSLNYFQKHKLELVRSSKMAFITTSNVKFHLHHKILKKLNKRMKEIVKRNFAVSRFDYSEK